MDEMREERGGKGRGERRRWVVIVLVVVVALAALLSQTCWKDPGAQRGHIEGIGLGPKGEHAEVGWDEMAISVAGVMEIAEGETRLEARIENVEANHCDQKVRMYLAESPDDVLFESGAIGPGEYLRYVEIAHPLEVGTHLMVVEFQGYEREASPISDEGVPLGHDKFGACCSAEVEVRVMA
jgi:hypothetical protein